MTTTEKTLQPKLAATYAQIKRHRSGVGLAQEWLTALGQTKAEEAWRRLEDAVGERVDGKWVAPSPDDVRALARQMGWRTNA